MKKSFTKYGEQFEFVESKGAWSIYSRSYKPVTGTYGVKVAYEVVRGIQRKGNPPSGKIMPSGLAYPSQSAWGKHGFTKATLESARAKLGELTRE